MVRALCSMAGPRGPWPGHRASAGGARWSFAGLASSPRARRVA